MINTVLDERFRIEESLAMSPNSEVYRATDLRTNQPVALKLIRPRFMVGQQFGARLRQEFQVLKNLDHPNVVQVLQIGETPNNFVYFAMEFVPGKTLAELIKKNGAIPPKKLTQYLDQIANALDAAHAQKIVHRDLNPGNLMILEKDGREVLKVFDFGLAKVLNVEPENAMVQTGAAKVMGNPTYMSPEQAMGKNVSHLSDVYSVGVILYEALTGQVPFFGRNDLDLIIHHAKTQVPKFAERNPNHNIPESIENVVIRALAKDPAARPQSMGELAKMFQQALSGGIGRRPSSSTVVSGRSPVTEMPHPGPEPSMADRSFAGFPKNSTKSNTGNNGVLLFVGLGVFVSIIVIVYVFFISSSGQ